MRLAALAAGLALAGAASAAEAPARVDFIVIAQLADQQWVPVRDGEYVIHPSTDWTGLLKVDHFVRGGTIEGPVRVSYQTQFRLKDDESSVYWLKRRPDGTFDLVCNQPWIVADRLVDPSGDDAGLRIPSDWQSRPCDSILLDSRSRHQG